MAELKSVLETLLAKVPGYAGYADRERRRETDQALRLAIAATLREARGGVDRQAAAAARAMAFDALEPLEALGRRADTLCDALRHAPAGYAALFDAVTVDAALLAEVYDGDLALRTAAETASGWLTALSFRDPATADAAHEALSAVEAAVRRRAEVLDGVAR